MMLGIGGAVGLQGKLHGEWLSDARTLTRHEELSVAGEQIIADEGRMRQLRAASPRRRPGWQNMRRRWEHPDPVRAGSEKSHVNAPSDWNGSASASTFNDG